MRYHGGKNRFNFFMQAYRQQSMNVDRRNSAPITGHCSRITGLLTVYNIFLVLINYEISHKLYTRAVLLYAMHGECVL